MLQAKIPTAEEPVVVTDPIEERGVYAPVDLYAPEGLGAEIVLSAVGVLLGGGAVVLLLTLIYKGAMRVSLDSLAVPIFGAAILGGLGLAGLGAALAGMVDHKHDRIALQRDREARAAERRADLDKLAA